MLADYFRQVGLPSPWSGTFTPRKCEAERLGFAGAVAGSGAGRKIFCNLQDDGTALDKNCRIFGVCLAWQAIGRIFRRAARPAGQPAHGRPFANSGEGGRLMQNLPNEIVIGRYHSLYVERDSMPDVLNVTASTEDGVAMAIEHKNLPVGGVQFHPGIADVRWRRMVADRGNAFRLGVPVN